MRRGDPVRSASIRHRSGALSEGSQPSANTPSGNADVPHQAPSTKHQPPYPLKLPWYHSNSFCTPSSISTLCVQPRECNLETSISLRIVPSGLEASNSTEPSKPTAFTTSSDSSRMVSSLPVPTLMWQLQISPSEGMYPPRPVEWLRSTTPSCRGSLREIAASGK